MQYLDAMGVEQFVPRKLLANSAELRLCELPVQLETSLDEVNAPQVEERPLPQAAEVVNRLLDTVTLVAEKSEIQSVKDSLQSQSSSGETSNPPQLVTSEIEQAQFSLAVWHLQNGVLAIDTHEPRSGLPTAKLLGNILLAGGLLNLNLPQAGVINWPLGVASQADAGWQAAREYVESYLDAANQKLETSLLLIFGDAALKSLISEEEAAQIQFGQKFSASHFSASAIYFPALGSILRHPEYKALVWRGLSRLGRAT